MEKPKIETVAEFMKRGGRVKKVDFSKAYHQKDYYKEIRDAGKAKIVIATNAQKDSK